MSRVETGHSQAGPSRPGRTKPSLPLRLWPGVAIVALQWLLRFVVPALFPEAQMVGALATLAGALAIVIWWVLFSRAPWLDRLVGVALFVGVLIASKGLLHESLATGGMGMIYFIYATPGLCLAFVVWAALSRGMATAPRLVTMAAAIALACGGWALVRTGGFSGSGESDFAWRWAATAEDRLLAAGDEPRPDASSRSMADVATDVPEPVRWRGFRGPTRDSIVRGVRIGTDWESSPPVELWRRPVGPGWSSFAVRGDLVYTQEQRGDEEVVSAYAIATGEPVWRHRDATRFWESNAGAGPRGTPTIDGDRVITLGATGIVNVLDAEDGTVRWSRDAASDTGAELPTWGFSSSPLVVEDLVIVAASGIVAAYDLASGARRWTGPSGTTSYSSPHWMTLDGVPQIVALHGEGVVGLAPADGAVLWQHEWSGYPIVQPAQTADGDLLVSVTDRSGVRRLGIRQNAGGWTVEERWTSIRLKPYFNDFVVHKGHAFGFDGSILACINVADGERAWKGGRYGNGQLLLLADQDLLLVLSEKGELALVRATTEAFTELARVPAISGKTWNHPVLVDDVLLVRNGEEMVAFRLPGTGT